MCNDIGIVMHNVIFNSPLDHLVDASLRRRLWKFIYLQTGTFGDARVCNQAQTKTARILKFSRRL